MFAESRAGVSARPLKVRDYHRAILFMRKEEVAYAEICCAKVRLSRANTLLEIFCTYGFDYFRGLFYVAFHTKVRVADVTELLNVELQWYVRLRIACQGYVR